MPIRVLLGVRGHSLLTGIQTLLLADANVRVVGAVESARQLHEQLSRTRLDVAVIDSALDVSINRELAHQVVMLVSDSPADSLLAAAAAAGVRAFVVRDGPVDEIARAIRAVHDGRAWVDPTIADRVIRLAGGQRMFSPVVNGVPLTARERQVLQCIAEGMSNTEIADKMAMAVRTVKYHVSHVLAKLGARDRAHAVALAHRAGFSEGACT